MNFVELNTAHRSCMSHQSSMCLSRSHFPLHQHGTLKMERRSTYCPTFEHSRRLFRSRVHSPRTVLHPRNPPSVPNSRPYNPPSQDSRIRLPKSSKGSSATVISSLVSPVKRRGRRRVKRRSRRQRDRRRCRSGLRRRAFARRGGLRWPRECPS